MLISRIIIFFLLMVYAGQTYGQIVNIEDKRSQFTDSIQWVEQLELGANFTKNKESVFAINGKAQIEFVYYEKTLISLTNFALSLIHI